MKPGIILFGNPEKSLKRLLVIAPLLFFIGLLIYFLSDKDVGISLIIAGLITSILGIIVYSKVKKGDKLAGNRLYAYFYIVSGIVLLTLALLILIFETEALKEIYLGVGLGLYFLIFGIYDLIKLNR